MIALESPVFLFASGCGNGRLLAVTGTATGTAVQVHEAVRGANGVDFLTIEANNISAGAVLLTIEWAGTTAAEQIQVSIPSRAEMTVVCDRAPIQQGLTVKAFAASANVINLRAYVQRYGSDAAS